MFTCVAVAALAVGIGANLTIFGFVNALLLRPLPATEPGRLVRSDLGGPNTFENHVPYDDYVDYRDRNQTLSHLSLFSPWWIVSAAYRHTARGGHPGDAGHGKLL